MAPSGTCSKAGTPWTEQYNKVRRMHTEYRALPHGGERISVIGMGSSVIGGGNRQHLRQVLGFLEAPAEQRDYSAISGFAPADAMGKCVYCKHCHPLSRRAGRGPDQQVLRPGPAGRRPGPGALPDPGKAARGLRGLRPLRRALSLPCGPEPPDAGNSGLFRGIIMKNKVLPGGEIGSLRAARFPAGFLTNGAVSVIIGPTGKFNSRAGCVRGG